MGRGTVKLLVNGVSLVDVVQSGPTFNPLLYRYGQIPIPTAAYILTPGTGRFALTSGMVPLGKKEWKKLLLIVDTNVNKTLKRGPAMKTSSITQQHTNNKHLSSNQETPIVSIA